MKKELGVILGSMLVGGAAIAANASGCVVTTGPGCVGCCVACATVVGCATYYCYVTYYTCTVACFSCTAPCATTVLCSTTTCSTTVLP